VFAIVFVLLCALVDALRPRREVIALISRMVRENPTWGRDEATALPALGHDLVVGLVRARIVLVVVTSCGSRTGLLAGDTEATAPDAAIVEPNCSTATTADECLALECMFYRCAPYSPSSAFVCRPTTFRYPYGVGPSDYCPDASVRP
jgi:hypothetical protein